MVFCNLCVVIFNLTFFECTGITQLPRYVQSVLDSELSTKKQVKARNIVLMNLYIVTQFVMCTVDRIGEESVSGVLNKVILFSDLLQISES